MIENITPQDAKRRMDEEGYAYLDVRSVPEFEQGHPNGAYNIPFLHLGSDGMEPNPEFLAAVERTFAKDQKIVIGCKSGGRSQRAAEQLAAAGFTNILDQRAGYGGARGSFGETTEPGWQDAGLPISNEAAGGRSWSELSRGDGQGG